MLCQLEPKTRITRQSDSSGNTKIISIFALDRNLVSVLTSMQTTVHFITLLGTVRVVLNRKHSMYLHSMRCMRTTLLPNRIYPK